MTAREQSQRRHELLDLAKWIAEHFNLGNQPKIHSAKESEVIYAQVLKRLRGIRSIWPTMTADPRQQAIRTWWIPRFLVWLSLAGYAFALWWMG